MKCLRCESEMKHYKFERDFGIHGKEHRDYPGAAFKQNIHNPHSIFVCDNCGYMELSTNFCEEEDI